MGELYDVPLKRIDGSETSLNAYAGKVLLIVNVASKCGLTPQYEALEALYRARHADGLEILGFPANNFMGQEPGTDQEIASFCQTAFDVSFPLFSKISVAGPDKHPLYDALTTAWPDATGSELMREKFAGYGFPPTPRGEVLWNFEKFVIGRKGDVVARFSPDVAPDDVRLIDAINKALAA
ncbi:glutathione peroxidase [Asticcacaulis sp. DW145]|uniref:Glutathione peroxidase n=1 Tax=Asticcacaulis currens TaxID=2984210 RepID=A0ABT5IIF6_9CAUL|nr:glutathione peroxidase [Asticcacaulis currens]MDC7695960.1 glutathione peroxidase [Asticcacaulis currens]BEV12599.1 glutathione peroxidase [Asticcacaulis sp. DW145]